jgi:poly(hydroxyalkanoate) granule-associated protein
MFETLDKMFLAGLGAISMTQDRAEKIFDEFVSRGKAEKDSKAGFIKTLMDAADKNRAELEKVIAKQMKETMERLDLPTREDIKRLEKKIDKLAKSE